ncbi:MAG: Na+/H+ antiporter NhaC family protein [Candidatus Delongbacteria bacterium]|jgi:Na+/H+ antiporter NhaC|nr:Na+/H+ antiporter NhaC family protein [Candidatus Delongbacteria bacterium]
MNNALKYSQILIFFTMVLILFQPLKAQESPRPDSIAIDIPAVIVENSKVQIGIALYKDQHLMHKNASTLPVNINGESYELQFTDGQSGFTKTFKTKENLKISCCDQVVERSVKPVPLWMSIIPPLIAILFALLFKEVFSALILGIFSGTLIISIHQGFGFFKGVFQAFLRLIDTYVISALNTPDHIAIIVFSMLIGGMVGIIRKNGGMRGVVEVLSRKATSSRSGQLMTWVMGFAVFFDDYANTLVVGNTMRNLIDKLRISREKLAYIVDSTAAPVASIAFITTWIGAELSYINNGIETIGLDTNPYAVFFASIKYSFYPIMALIFVFFVIMTRREYGPMYNVELKSRQSPEIEEGSQVYENPKSPGFNALIPVLVIVFGTLAGLLYSGWDASLWNNPNMGFGTKLSQTIGQADSFKALLWSSFAAVIVAIILTISQKLMNLRKTIEAMVGGFQTMLNAILILTFAWALAQLTEDLHTAAFISQIMDNLSVSPYFIPALSFLFSALIAFSTGSSWGTMAIMYPLILPSSWLIFMNNGLDHATSMMLFNNVVSTVIAGSVLGDHCSPISDTTILSSLASGSDHIQHVRTQMPYVLTVGVVAVLLGTIPAAYGVPVYLCYAIGIGILFLILRVFGKKLPVTKL